MGQIASALVVAAGAEALSQGVQGKDSLTVAGLAGLILLIVGGALFLAETVRAWRRPRP